mgnify:CR=1 FL=1
MATALTNGELLGKWEYNDSAIVALQRANGWVIMIYDGKPAQTPAIKGKDWLKLTNLFNEATLDLFLDDDSIENKFPTAAELATFAALSGYVKNDKSEQTQNPISLVQAGTTQQPQDTKQKKWIIGIVVLAVAIAGYFAFKK